MTRREARLVVILTTIILVGPKSGYGGKWRPFWSVTTAAGFFLGHNMVHQWTGKDEEAFNSAKLQKNRVSKFFKTLQQGLTENNYCLLVN